jgi:hypothetical protein
VSYDAIRMFLEEDSGALEDWLWQRQEYYRGRYNRYSWDKSEEKKRKFLNNCVNGLHNRAVFLRRVVQLLDSTGGGSRRSRTLEEVLADPSVELGSLAKPARDSGAAVVGLVASRNLFGPRHDIAHRKGLLIAASMMWMKGLQGAHNLSKMGKAGTASATYKAKVEEFNEACARNRGMTYPNATRGWKLGDPLNNLTREGNVPSWDAVRQRYWRNDALNNSSDYSRANLERMRQGLALQRLNPRTGKIESMELHHRPPRREGGLFDVEAVWPGGRAAIDPFRKRGG